MVPHKWRHPSHPIRYAVVHSCLLVFYVLSVLLGFSLHMYDRSTKRLVVSKLLTMYSVALGLIPVYKYNTANELLTLSGESRSIVSIVVDNIERAILVQTLIFGSVRRYSSWKKMVVVYNDFMKIAVDLGVPKRTVFGVINEKLLKKLAISSFLLVVPIVSIYLQKSRVEREPPDYLSLITSIYPKVMIVYASTVFNWQVVYLNRLLELINAKLGAMVEEVTREVSFATVGKMPGRHTKKLHQIMILRERVCDLTYRLNKTYNYQMLVIFVLISILIVSQIYFLLTAANRYARYSQDVSAILSLAVLFMCLLNCYEAYCIADACESIKQQSRKTSVLLYKLISQKIDADLKRAVELFLIQLLHHPIQFTVYGMFRVDYSMLFSIVTSTVSYLIILMQFELGSGCR